MDAHGMAGGNTTASASSAVSAFVSLYFLRQSGNINNRAKFPEIASCEFRHRLCVGVTATATQKPSKERSAAPQESLHETKRRLRDRLLESDPKDAAVRSFRVDDVLSRLGRRNVPEAFLALLRLLAHCVDHDPTLVNYTTDNSIRDGRDKSDQKRPLSNRSSDARAHDPSERRQSLGRPSLDSLGHPRDRYWPRRAKDDRSKCGERGNASPRDASSRRRSNSSEDENGDYADTSDDGKRYYSRRRPPRPRHQESDSSSGGNSENEPIMAKTRKQAGDKLRRQTDRRHRAQKLCDEDNRRAARSSPGRRRHSPSRANELADNLRLLAGPVRAVAAVASSEKSSRPPVAPYWGELPQAVILRDLLYPLQGINGTYIKWHSPSRCFLIRRDVHVSKPIRTLVARLALLGSYYRRIRDVIDSHLLPTPETPDEFAQWWGLPPPRDGGVLGHPKITVMTSSAAGTDVLESNAAELAGGGNHVGEDAQLVAPIVTFPSSAAPLGSYAPPGGHFVPGGLDGRREGNVRAAGGSLLRRAWHHFVSKVLAQYYEALATVEAQLLKSSDPLGPDFQTPTVDISTGCTLRKLVVTFAEISERMAIIAETTEALQTVKGPQLLATLYDVAFRGDALGRVLLTEAIVDAVLPVWCRQLNEWLATGAVDDPYDEFFIQSELSSPEDLHMLHAGGTKATECRDLHWLWTRRASINRSNVPGFMNLEIAELALAAGKLHSLIEAADCLLSFDEVSAGAAGNVIATTGVEKRGPVTRISRNCQPPKLLDHGVTLFKPSLERTDTADGAKASDKSQIATSNWAGKEIAKLFADCDASIEFGIELDWRSVQFSGSRHSAEAVKWHEQVHLRIANYFDNAAMMNELQVEMKSLQQSRSITLLNELLTNHSILQIFNFMHNIVLLLQQDFVGMLLRHTCADNDDLVDLRSSIHAVTPHQLTGILTKAIQASHVANAPFWVKNRLSLEKMQSPVVTLLNKHTAAWKMITLKWESQRTAARLFITDEAMEVMQRLQAFVWRLMVTSHSLSENSWIVMQDFRRRFYPVNTAQHLLTPRQVLEALDEEGYLATFICEALQQQLSHTLLVLRQCLLQDYASAAWQHLIRRLQGLVLEPSAYTNSCTNQHYFSGAQPPNFAVVLPHCEISIDCLRQCYAEYLSSLAVGWFLVEKDGQAALDPALISSGRLELETEEEIDEHQNDSLRRSHRPILSAILGLTEVAEKFVAAVGEIYTALNSFIILGKNHEGRDEKPSVAWTRLTELHSMLQRTTDLTCQLCEALLTASAELPLSAGSVVGDRSTLLRALVAQLDLQHFFDGVESGSKKLLTVAGQLIAESASR